MRRRAKAAPLASRQREKTHTHSITHTDAPPSLVSGAAFPIAGDGINCTPLLSRSLARCGNIRLCNFDCNTPQTKYNANLMESSTTCPICDVQQSLAHGYVFFLAYLERAALKTSGKPDANSNHQDYYHLKQIQT